MDNEGPHCRNCHTGASSCNQCHGVDSLGAANDDFGAPTSDNTNGWTSFAAGDAFAHTDAVIDVGGQCVDGGFSFPHRTLGKDMLKDELYGVNFDGDVIDAGETRASTAAYGDFNAYLANYANPWAASETSENSTSAAGSVMDFESGEQIVNRTAENLDSVCIDCHGSATTWNGDNPDAYTKDGADADTLGDGESWELLWKGLP